MSETSNRLRRRMLARDPEESHRASTPLELLFDLTFVVAVAVAGAEFHHALSEGHVTHGLLGFLMVFFCIWWAWMNFTWFASAYDTDDVPYRLLTLLQMGGVLVLASGIKAAFEHFDFTIVVAGYVIMRVALVAQWLRAAAEHPEGRSATLRYAVGVSVVQAAWVAQIWLPGYYGLIAFVVLVIAELAVPAWAEFVGQQTAWHPAHIAERYGLFTIICLGEVILATTAAMQSALAAGGASPSLLLAAMAGLLLVFGLWWSYFKHSADSQLRLSLRAALGWGYGHYAIFVAVAALGAGLQVVIDTITHQSHVTPVFAAFTVAIPVAIFLVVLGLLGVRLDREEPTAMGLVIGTAVLVLLAPLTARIVALPVTLLIIAVLVALLLAYHLTVLHRANE